MSKLTHLFGHSHSHSQGHSTTGGSPNLTPVPSRERLSISSDTDTMPPKTTGKSKGKLMKQHKEAKQPQGITRSTSAHASVTPLPTLSSISIASPTPTLRDTQPAQFVVTPEDRSLEGPPNFNNPFAHKSMPELAFRDDSEDDRYIEPPAPRFSNPFADQQVSQDPSNYDSDADQSVEGTPQFHNPFTSGALPGISIFNDHDTPSSDITENKNPFIGSEADEGSFSTPLGSPAREFTNPFRDDSRKSPSPRLQAGNHTHIDLAREDSAAESVHAGIDWSKYPAVERSISQESGYSDGSVGAGSSRRHLGELKARHHSRESSATSTPVQRDLRLQNVALHTPDPSPHPALHHVNSAQIGAAVASVVGGPVHEHLSVAQRNPVATAFWTGFLFPALWVYGGWFMNGRDQPSSRTVEDNLEKGEHRHEEKFRASSSSVLANNTEVQVVRRDPWIFRCRVAAVIASIILLALFMIGLYYLGQRSRNTEETE